jgi:hypothetical protein
VTSELPIDETEPENHVNARRERTQWTIVVEESIVGIRAWAQSPDKNLAKREIQLRSAEHDGCTIALL